MGKIEKDTLAFEMAKQLHEQYAINDNAKVSSVTSFLAAIAFVFIGFGYIYIQPYLNESKQIDNYSQLLFSAYILTIVVLTLISVLCINFGYSTRRDHIVIGKIRKDEGVDDWFGDGCGKNVFTFLPSYYNIMFVFLQIFIILIAVGCCMNEINDFYCCTILIATIAIIINTGYLSIAFRIKYKNIKKNQNKTLL